MHADLKGSLAALDRSYKVFEHDGKPMTKEQVKKVLEYGISKGYDSTADFSDDEIDKLLKINQ